MTRTDCRARKLRMGMVGGGRNAFIGAVHRMAAGLDGSIELAAGAFSSSPERSRESGRDLLLPEDRVYGTYQEMMERERELEPERRIDFVSIVTPNDQHAPVATAALVAGFPVICDKPLATSLREAKALGELVASTGLAFGLTHNYSGYPMVKEARARVLAGELGAIRRVVAEYPQGWLATRLEATGQKQAEWRTDPRRAGASCCVGDIGTHAAHLAELVSGQAIASVSADLHSFVPERPLDDDASVLLRFQEGAKGLLWASQIAVDEENGLKLRVYGERGGLEWKQEEPNTLTLKWLDRPRETIRTGVNYAGLSPAALAAARLPAGHPEGYLEAFANLYRSFALELRGERPEGYDVPTVSDGIRGMAFIEACVESSANDGKWTRLDV